MATLDCSFIIVEEKHGNTGIELTPNYKRRSPVIKRRTCARSLLFFHGIFRYPIIGQVRPTKES